MEEDYSGLTSVARRGLARNLFSGFYERGLSANQALKELQSVGLGYNRSNFLNDYASERPGYDQSIRVSHINDSVIPKESLLESKYHGVEDKYSFVFKATGEDINTGESREQYFFYHRQTLDTAANMKSDAEEWISEQTDQYGMEISKVTLVEGYINPLWS